MQENIVHNWLSRRGITPNIIKNFNIRGGVHEVMGDCIIIPVLNFEGEFSFNKYRRNPMVDAKPKYVYDRGGKITLYGWYEAKDKDAVLITEGEMDTLVAWSANIPAITSTGGANSFQKEWAELLADKDVTLCFDNDEAGARGMVKALRIIPHAYVVFLPDRPGVKDISDYVSSGGNLAELLRTRIKFDSLQDVVDDRSRRLSTWQSVFFHDAYIEDNTVPEYVKVERKGTWGDNDKVANAKAYPIPELIKVDRTGKALCIWHDESTESLHYYIKTNTVYRFGCGKYGDAIEVYKQINNCSFKEAVEKLQ